jgi:hypothetical protein
MNPIMTYCTPPHEPNDGVTLALIPAWTHSLPLARPCGPSVSDQIPFAVSQTAQVSPGEKGKRSQRLGVGMRGAVQGKPSARLISFALTGPKHIWRLTRGVARRLALPRAIIFRAFSLVAAMLLTCSVFAADTNMTPEQVEAKYTATIEGRTADILKVLNLDDTNKIAGVHDAIMAQYRALNAWHSENDAKLKAARGDTNATAQIRSSLKALHEKFLDVLAENLSPDQIEKVKDKMTYGKVQFTYQGYVAQYPSLSETNKAEIMRLLKEAREEAMDGGSANEKTAVFTRYKGKINNYLSKQGIQSEKKMKTSTSATNAVSPQ